MGIINQSLSFYMIFTVISNFGVQASSQKHASQFIDNKDKLASMGKKAKLKVRNDHDKRLAGKNFREYIFECIE